MVVSEATNLNTLSGVCFFYTSQRAENSPAGSSSRFVGFNISVSEGWASQLVVELGSSNVYARGKYDGVWGEWAKK